MSSSSVTSVEWPLLWMRSSTSLEFALHGLPVAVQYTVQLNWPADCGTSSEPLPGSSNDISAWGPTACGKAFLLNSTGIAPRAALGIPPCAVAVVVTGQLVNPKMPLK